MSTKNYTFHIFWRLFVLMVGSLALLGRFDNAKTVSASTLLQVSDPPTSIDITAPSVGTINQSFAFTATVSPSTAALPITYTWIVTKDDGTTESITHSGGGLSDSLSYTWAAGGYKYIIVTAENSSGSRNKVFYFPVEVPAFLYPPYPSADPSVVSVFDNETPRYGADSDHNSVLTWRGEIKTGTWTNGIFDGLQYPGHAGIDYGLGYLPMFASADSNQVVHAGWVDPIDHRAGLGLRVELRHTNGYHTVYAHLSSVSVRSCTQTYCPDIKQGDVIGISGDTGASTGPHLHFEVRSPYGYQNDPSVPIPVDPYGYDPIPTSLNPQPGWQFTQPNSLWIDPPPISGQPAGLGEVSRIPSGSNVLGFPATPAGGVVVDDYAHLPGNDAPNFSVQPDCWQKSTEKPVGYAENNYNLFKDAVISTDVNVDTGTCWVRWYLPIGQPTGEYSIYVRIPQSDNVDYADNALYRIFRAGSEIAKINVSQFAINNPVLRGTTYSSDPTVNAGWVYLGNYLFPQTGSFVNYVELTDMVVGDTRNVNQAGDPVVQDPKIAVDAVKFVRATSSKNVDTVLIIDSSGSMTTNDPQNKRLQASRFFVTNAAVQDDYVGVVDFDGTVRVATNPPLQKLHDNDAAAVAAINTINSSGGTNIGIGVQKGCDLLILSDRLDYRKGAILLTDGVGSFSGQDQCFMSKGWPIFTFGFGGANDAQLQLIASNTGGRYKRVDNLTSLTCEFIRVRTLIANAEPQPCTPYIVPQLASISFSQTVALGQAQATFSTGWPGSDVIMTLTAPSGRIIDRSTVAPDVLHENGSTYEVYTIANPESGNWNVSLYGANVPIGGEEVIFGFASVPAPEPTSCTASNAYASSQSGYQFASYKQTSSLTNFDRLPLSFVPNFGQEDEAVKFQAQGLGGKLFFTPSEVVFSLPNPIKVKEDDKDKIRYDLHPANVVRIQYQGANENPEVVGIDELPGVVNFLKGNDPSKWIANLPIYSGIAYRELYPGIELRYEGTDGNLKSMFYIAPGTNPSAIVWRYKGAENVSVDESGNLVIALPSLVAGEPGKTLYEQAPIAWQDASGGNRVMVAVQFSVDKKDKKVSFVLPNGYDSTLPLVIDPTLTYSTYLGGTKTDEADAVTLDADCNVYLTGKTSSSAFPTTPDAYQTNQPNEDVFVSKLNAAGDTLLYSTYIGGSGDDHAWDIGLDNQGRITIVGETESSDFPTWNAYDSNYHAGTCDSDSCDDVFVTQLTVEGNSLRYSTYLGGNADDEALAMALGPDDKIYLTGITRSSTFPTVNGYDTSFGGGTCSGYPCEDVFVTKVDPALTGADSLPYSTFLGGSNYDKGRGIAIDSAGYVYVTGYTRSDGLATPNAYQLARIGDSDVFIAKFDTTVSGSNSRLYTTYLGGDDSDHAHGIALLGPDQVYITGYTESLDFPTHNPFDGLDGMCGSNYCLDAFVTHLNIANNTLVYSSFLGGSADDEANSITVDNAGNAYVTGYTESTNFPLQNEIQSQKGTDSCSSPPCADAFITKVNAAGTAMVYSTYLGGSAEDYGTAIVVDGLGGVYVVGYTYSSNLFSTPTFPYVGGSGYKDAFIVKLDD